MQHAVFRNDWYVIAVLKQFICFKRKKKDKKKKNKKVLFQAREISQDNKVLPEGSVCSLGTDI